MIWVTTSGGVMMAAPMKNSSSAYFRFFLRNSTETSPIRDMAVMTNGISNTTPKASSSLVAKARYSRMEGRA